MRRWFKCRRAFTEQHADTKTHSATTSSGKRCDDGIFGERVISAVKFELFYNFVTGSLSWLNFFVQQHITHNKETNADRYNHSKRLIDEVFQKWISVPAELSEDRMGCNHSFIKLYVNIADDLKNLKRYPRAKSHLEYDGYSKPKTLLESIETTSKTHNDIVNSFIESLEPDIKSSISKSNTNIQQFTNNEVERGYALDRILSHYRREALGYHSALRIDSFGPNEFFLHRQDDNSTVIARDSDSGILENLSQIIGGELQTEKVNKLRDLSKEGNRICTTFNEQFIPEIQNIVTEFEDEQKIHGGCGLSFCPKPKTMNAQPKNPQ